MRHENGFLCHSKHLAQTRHSRLASLVASHPQNRSPPWHRSHRLVARLHYYRLYPTWYRTPTRPARLEIRCIEATRRRGEKRMSGPLPRHLLSIQSWSIRRNISNGSPGGCGALTPLDAIIRLSQPGLQEQLFFDSSVVSLCHRTTSTEQLACCTTRVDTLPRKNLAMAPNPLAPITIKSAR